MQYLLSIMSARAGKDYPPEILTVTFRKRFLLKMDYVTTNSNIA